MAGRHVFITGATGFVGSWLADHFASAGEIVTALVNEVPVGGHFDRCVAGRVNMVYGSVLDASLLNRVMADRGIDTVFHCAAVSTQPLAQRHPFEAFEVNVRGTYTLLEACRINLDVVRRVVVASSDKVYGDSDDLPYLEQHPLLGLNPYDASKCCADVIARSYHHGYGLPVVVGRFGNIYGGADLNWSRLIPGTIRRLMRGESPIMRSSARGEFRRDFLYIDDLVRACSALVEKFDAPGIAGSAFNFGTEREYPVADVVTLIQRILGRENVAPVMVSNVPGEITCQRLCPARAKASLGWSAQIDLEEGISRTVEWYKEYFGSHA